MQAENAIRNLDTIRDAILLIMDHAAITGRTGHAVGLSQANTDLDACQDLIDGIESGKNIDAAMIETLAARYAAAC